MIFVRQAVKYGIVGAGQIGLDWLIFVLLSQFGLAPSAANVTGRIVGALVGFWLNGRWTFSSAESTPLGASNLTRFAVSWVLTTLLSTAAVVGVDQAHGLHWAWVIKPIVDAALAAAGFLASKYWIYRSTPTWRTLKDRHV
jgi:putative flippase GtrA